MLSMESIASGIRTTRLACRYRQPAKQMRCATCWYQRQLDSRYRQQLLDTTLIWTAPLLQAAGTSSNPSAIQMPLNGNKCISDVTNGAQQALGIVGAAIADAQHIAEFGRSQFVHPVPFIRTQHVI